VQRAPGLPLAQRAIGGSRAGARALEVAHDDGVEAPVVLLDAREIEIEQLQAAELLAADGDGQLRGGAERRVEHRAALPAT
jgi:hypothetical protein